MPKLQHPKVDPRKQDWLGVNHLFSSSAARLCFGVGHQKTLRDGTHLSDCDLPEHNTSLDTIMRDELAARF